MSQIRACEDQTQKANSTPSKDGDLTKLVIGALVAIGAYLWSKTESKTTTQPAVEQPLADSKHSDPRHAPLPPIPTSTQSDSLP